MMPRSEFGGAEWQTTTAVRYRKSVRSAAKHLGSTRHSEATSDESMPVSCNTTATLAANSFHKARRRVSTKVGQKIPHDFCVKYAACAQEAVWHSRDTCAPSILLQSALTMPVLHTSASRAMKSSLNKEFSVTIRDLSILRICQEER